jgi:hypothetical protein
MMRKRTNRPVFGEENEENERQKKKSRMRKDKESGGVRCRCRDRRMMQDELKSRSVNEK